MKEKINGSVVKDHEATISKSCEVAKKMIKSLKQEMEKFECDDDPAEYIYLSLHCMSRTLFTFCTIMESYSKEIYGIKELNSDKIFDFVCHFTKTYLKSYGEGK